MIRMLFVTEKWVDVTPGNSLTNSFHNLFGSLESTGLAEFECIHFDEYFATHNDRCDNYVLERCEQYKPDAVFFSYFPYRPWGVMLEDTLVKIKSMGIKTIFIWWDGIVPMKPELVDLAISACDGVTPEDPKIYNDPGLDRDIDVSFCGTIYCDRPYFLQHVIEKLGSKIRAAIGEGQRKSKLTVEEYASLYKRSKMVMNFCNLNQIRSQVKGRVFESMFCGAMLLEQDNEHIKRFFKPYEHYVPFSTPQDLCDKIEHYLSYPEDRLKIAAAGNKLCNEQYNATNWWRKVFEQTTLI